MATTSLSAGSREDWLFACCLLDLTVVSLAGFASVHALAVLRSPSYTRLWLASMVWAGPLLSLFRYNLPGEPPADGGVLLEHVYHEVRKAGYLANLGHRVVS